MFVTGDGFKKLEAELEQLLLERDTMMQSLGEEARSDGYVDLRENVTFMEKRTRLQNEYVVRIAELREILTKAKIVEDQKDHLGLDTNVVRIGSKVTVIVDGERMVLTIVGKREGNPRQGLISYEAPVGQALMGAAPGDVIFIQTPGGAVEYKVINIEYVL